MNSFFLIRRYQRGNYEKRRPQYMRVLKDDPKNLDVHSELKWASAMAENGILKISKTSSFQAHQIEHQLGTYTDCNHGQGLAVVYINVL